MKYICGSSMIFVFGFKISSFFLAIYAHNMRDYTRTNETNPYLDSPNFKSEKYHLDQKSNTNFSEDYIYDFFCGSMEWVLVFF